MFFQIRQNYWTPEACGFWVGTRHTTFTTSQSWNWQHWRFNLNKAMDAEDLASPNHHWHFLYVAVVVFRRRSRDPCLWGPRWSQSDNQVLSSGWLSLSLKDSSDSLQVQCPTCSYDAMCLYELQRETGLRRAAVFRVSQCSPTTIKVKKWLLCSLPPLVTIAESMLWAVTMVTKLPGF